MSELRRDNHFIPKLYLKNWAQDGKILSYRLLVPHQKVPLWKAHPLKGIAFHQHLYTYTQGDKVTDEFERWLDSEFESPAAEAIQRVVQEQRLSRNDWRRLISFALCQDLRTPAHMRQFLERLQRMLPEMIDQTIERSITRLRNAAVHGTPLESNPKALKPSSFDDCPFRLTSIPEPDGTHTLKAEAVVGRRTWLWQMRMLLTETIQKIEPKGWTVLHAPPGMTWPTSDNPLIRVGVCDDGSYKFGTGWKSDKADLLLPISPKHLLHCTVGQRPAVRGSVVDRRLAQTIRRMIVQHADQYVFSVDAADIAELRPRVVDSQRYAEELRGWKNWGREQDQVERKFSGGS